MTSSGRKRGLAVAATAALALSGLAFAGTAQAQNLAEGTPNGTLRLYTGDQSGAYTNQFDGNNSSVQLLANVSDSYAGQNAVRFQYMKGVTPVTIATVPIFDGLATANWVAPGGAEGAAITSLRAQVLDNINNVIDTYDVGGVAGTATPNVGSEPVSIAANNRDSVGLSPDGAIVVTGKTAEGVASVGDTFVNTQLQNEGPAVDNNLNFFPISTDVADVNALTPYAAIVPIDAGNLTADPVDEVVITTRIFAEGDDVRVLSVYDQVVTTISKATAPGFPANVAGGPPNEHTRWVISVKDQNGAPVSGLDIYESDISGVNLLAGAGMGRLVDNSAAFNDGETDWQGTLTVRLNESNIAPIGYGIDGIQDADPAPGIGATYVTVDVNQDGNYDNGIDQILRLDITDLPQAPATVDIVSSLGNVMDADESTDLTFTVKDANGDPIQSANVSGTIDRDVADNTPADSSTPFGPLVTDANGEVDLPAQQLGVNNNEVAVTVNATSGSAAGTLAVETDEAVTTWDEYPTSQVLANTSTTESATVALPSGSVLPGRTIGTTLAHLSGGNSVVAPQAEQPAGTLTGSPTTASSVTDANGRYSVKINDPAAPVGQELNNELQGAANDAVTGFNINGGDCPPPIVGLPTCLNLDLDWLRTLTPTRVEIHDDVNGDTDDGLRPGLDPSALLPGGLGIGEVVAFNADEVELDDVDVNLTLDEGFFVKIDDAFENVAIGNKVDFKSAGQSLTVNTGEIVGAPGIGNGQGAFLANIERNAGFDDDGLVEDEINATAGAATDEHDLTWTTVGTPINPRDTNPLVVELSASQESSILPKARAGNLAGVGQEVDYDVSTWDQFGNPTRQNTDVDDSNPISGFSGGNTSDFALFQPAISAFSAAATNQSLEVELEGERIVTYTDNPFDSSFDPGNPLAFLTIDLTNIEENTAPINWYDVNYDASTFSLVQQGPNTVPVGTAVTEVLTAADQEGQPLENLPVDFLRGGPGSEDDDSCFEDLLNNCQATDGNGQAFYDFVGGSIGTATISAVVYEPVVDGGTRIGTIGPDTVRFGSLAEIEAVLTGKNASNNRDRLKVNAESIAAQATVRLQKKVNGKWKKVGKTKTLNAFGNKVFKVKDKNGNKVTKYRAKVSPTTTTKKDTSNVVKQK